MQTNEPVNEYLASEFRPAVFPVDIFNVEGITIHEQMVYIVLHSYCNAHNNTAFPKIETIAKQARMSVRQVKYCLKSLVEKGLIDRQSQFVMTEKKAIKQTSNKYTMRTPKPAAPKPQPPKQELPDPKDRGAGYAPEGVQDMHPGGAGYAPGGCTACTPKEINLRNQSKKSIYTRGNSSPKKSKTTPAAHDPRYAAFYQLFPDA